MLRPESSASNTARATAYRLNPQFVARLLGSLTVLPIIAPLWATPALYQSKIPMKLTRFSASFALLTSVLASGCAISINDSGSAVAKIHKTPISSSFQCIQSASGQCNYALYTGRCSTVEGADGKPATSCNYQVFEEFTVPVGQTREVRQLPDGYKQCMRPDLKPKVPNCD